MDVAKETLSFLVQNYQFESLDFLTKLIVDFISSEVETSLYG